MTTSTVRAWSWRDITAHAARLVDSPERYVEVEHDGGHTIVEIFADSSARVWLGVEIDWCDVVAADVLGRRRYEMDLTVVESAMRDSALPEVA